MNNKVTKFVFILFTATVLISCNKDLKISEETVESISGQIAFNYEKGLYPETILDFEFTQKDTIGVLTELLNKSSKVYSHNKATYGDIELYVNHKNGDKTCLILYLLLDRSVFMYSQSGCNEGILIGQYSSIELFTFFDNFIKSNGHDLTEQ